MKTTSMVLIALAGFTAALAQSTTSTVLVPGEELVYKVKYGFVRLGTVTVTTVHDASTRGSECKLVMRLESNPSVPFVNIHEYNESVIDTRDFMSRRFYSSQVHGGNTIEVQFHRDSVDHRTYFSRKNMTTGLVMASSVLEDSPLYLEGPSLFFYGRWRSRSREVVNVPTFVEGTIQPTTLDFTKGRQYIEIDAVDQHVRTRKYEGQSTGNISSAGMTGAFTIWVSDDDAAVPVRAEMKIAVGSVTMELEKWTRPGWTPPS